MTTASTPDFTDDRGEESPNVDPSVGKYYRDMAEGWGAHVSKGWRGWLRRLAFWR